MRTALRDWWRGYSERDAESARRKVDALPVKRGNPLYVTLILNRREWRAFFGEGMSYTDGMRGAVGCHLPAVNFMVDGEGYIAESALCRRFRGVA